MILSVRQMQNLIWVKGTKNNGMQLPEYYVQNITRPIHGSNRTIIPMADKLLQTPCSLTIGGNVQKNKRDIM